MKITTILTLFMLLAGICQAQTSRSFTWVAWKDVSPKTKTALKQVKADKDGTVYDVIIELLEEQCEISVAVIDLDGDGKMEYAFGTEGRYCCGTQGCTFRIFMDGGNKQIYLIDFWQEVKPAKSGVVSSKGLLMKFNTQKW